jgi:translation initiation factor IF-2
MAQKIDIEDSITVGDLADKLSIPATQLIGGLMKNGVMVTVNERLDFDTAQIIVEEMELEVELVHKQNNDDDKRVKRKASSQAVSRPPVVAVMGHVDHGKTSLLDAIRSKGVAEHEAGGITQHISAYQVEHGGRLITFLDTPGHEAFAAMREHGAKLTDLVVLVVAADDGIKPQTVEAIRFAKKANVKILVAITKIDKPEADPNRVKQQLSEQNLLIEEWGGDVIALGVSAKSKEGIKELLDMILLLADVEELKADTDVSAEGLIIESHMEKGRGPVAVALIESGILQAGDFIVAGKTYARVRNLDSTDGKTIKKATPSTPALISGFKKLPEFGDYFISVKTEKAARELVEKAGRSKKSESSNNGISSSDLIKRIDRSKGLSELNVILKADVQGSLTSLVDSLKTLNTNEVAVRVVGSGIGAINENDLHLANSSKAIIYGFNVSLPPGIKQIASRDKVIIRQFKVIYELIDDAKEELTQLLAPEIIEKVEGKLEVKAIFKSSKTDIICGGEVKNGKLKTPMLARVIRAKQQIAEVEIVNIKRGPQDAKEVVEGEMCGISLKTTSKLTIEIGDTVEAFTRQTIARKL